MADSPDAASMNVLSHSAETTPVEYRRTKDLQGFDRLAGSLTFRSELSALVPQASRENSPHGPFASEPVLIGTEKYCQGGS
jgi:hypothetical protein